MAHSPRSGDARRGAVQPPNEAGPDGNRAHNGYLPLIGSAGAMPLGGPAGGDRRNGSFSLAGVASPVRLPNQRFDVEAAKMPQPPSAVELGRGAIPVTPWNAAGRPSLVMPDADLPERR